MKQKELFYDDKSYKQLKALGITTYEPQNNIKTLT